MGHVIAPQKICQHRLYFLCRFHCFHYLCFFFLFWSVLIWFNQGCFESFTSKGKKTDRQTNFLFPRVMNKHTSAFFCIQPSPKEGLIYSEYAQLIQYYIHLKRVRWVLRIQKKKDERKKQKQNKANKTTKQTKSQEETQNTKGGR